MRQPLLDDNLDMKFELRATKGPLRLKGRLFNTWETS